GSGAGRPASLAEKLLDLRGVARGHLGVAGEATRHAGRLVLEQVALAGALAEHLAGAGDLEALAGAAVRLVLRHSAVLSSSVALRCPVTKTGHGGASYLYRILLGPAAPGVTPRREPRPWPRRPRRSATCRGWPSPPPCGLPVPGGPRPSPRSSSCASLGP